MKRYAYFLVLILSANMFPERSLAQAQLPDSLPRGWFKKFLPEFGIDEQMSKRINAAKHLSVLLYFRPAYRVGVAYEEGADGRIDFRKPSSPAEGSFFLRPLRLDIRGPIVPDKLDFRFRTRAFPLVTPNDLNQSNGVNFNLDYAYINYHINDKFELMGGKSLRLYGGYEWDLLPFQIYQYNKFLLSTEYFFPLGVQLRYRFHKQHSIIAGVYQPNNAKLTAANPSQTLFGAFNIKLLPDQSVARFPIGWGIYWDGSFLKGKLQTKWSVFTERRLHKEANITAVMGQRWKTKNWSWWIDVSLAYIASDLSSLLSPLYGQKVAPDAIRGGTDFNTRYVLKDMFYSVFSTRLDWRLGKWAIVFTGQYEQANQLPSALQADFQPVLGRAFRKSVLTNISLEYYPIASQAFSFFASSQQENTFFSQRAKNIALGANSFAYAFLIGMMYPLPIF